MLPMYCYFWIYRWLYWLDELMGFVVEERYRVLQHPCDTVRNQFDCSLHELMVHHCSN